MSNIYYICVSIVCAHRSPTKRSHPLNLELEDFVSCPEWVLGVELRCSGIVANTGNCRAISASLPLTFLVELLSTDFLGFLLRREDIPPSVLKGGRFFCFLFCFVCFGFFFSFYFSVIGWRSFCLNSLDISPALWTCWTSQRFVLVIVCQSLKLKGIGQSCDFTLIDLRGDLSLFSIFLVGGLSGDFLDFLCWTRNLESCFVFNPLNRVLFLLFLLQIVIWCQI